MTLVRYICQIPCISTSSNSKLPLTLPPHKPYSHTIRQVQHNGTFLHDPAKHFNYVMQTASAGGKWVGIYNPATKALTETPAPEDF
jgi:hypothetical protein